MKRVKTPLVLIIIAAAIGLILFSGDGNNKIDSTDKFHQELYEMAVGGWDASLTAGPFNSQEIDGKNIGSSSTIHVDWNQPEQEYNHFVLTISDPASDWMRKESGEHDRISLDLDMLSPDTNYTVTVQACLEPTCEEWLISEVEADMRTAKMYWKLDGEGAGETFVSALYEAAENDSDVEDFVLANQDNSVLLWPDGTQLGSDEAAVYLDGTYVQELMTEFMHSDLRHLTFMNSIDGGEDHEPVASAMLLNP